MSDLVYPKGKLESYLFPSEKQALIAQGYANDTFIWNDIEDVLDDAYVPPEPYYKHETGLTSRPFIPLSQEEIDYLIELNKDKRTVQIVKYFLEIQHHLKSRNFNAAKELLPALGKLNKQDYSWYAYPECPNCILLRLFNINQNEQELKTKESRCT